MGSIYTSVEQLIGRTPLLELANLQREEGLEARILAKLECFNPAGSVKDRVARAMRNGGASCGPAPSSSSPPPAIRESAWPPWPLPGDTG